MTQRLCVLAVIYLLATAGNAAAQTTSTEIRATKLTMPAFAVDDQAQTDWQRQYDAARATKNSGKKKMLLGAGIGAGAFIVANLAADSCVDSAFSGRTDFCDGERNTMTWAAIGSAGGGAIFIWGIVQFMDGNGEMRALESRRPAGSAAATLHFGDSAVDISVGRTTSAAYRLAW